MDINISAVKCPSRKFISDGFIHEGFLLPVKIIKSDDSNIKALVTKIIYKCSQENCGYTVGENE